MFYKIFVTISIMVMLLTGCSSGGPTNNEAKEVIYGVYFLQASIIEKQHCDPIPSWLEEQGYRNVWLVRYRFIDSGNTGGMLLAESDSEEYPWDIAGSMVESCP